MIKAALAVYLAQIESALHKYRWAGAELGMRGLTTLFLMYLFLKVNPRALPLRNPQVKINHFLVPVLMFGITANFAACLVDIQIGQLDHILRYCNQSLASISISYSSPSPIPTHLPNGTFFLKHILTPKKKKKHFFCRKKMEGADQTSLLLLHDLGSTMLLGFLIHVGLTFLVMQTRFNRCPHSHSRDEFPAFLLEN